MKRIKMVFVLLFTCFISSSLFAQKASWKEMEDFHTVMSTTFHPAEENDLGPVKTKSDELVSKAISWKKSSVPEGYDASLTKPVLKKLVTQCKELQSAVAAKKSDTELKVKITEAHDTFHEIMEKCRKEDKH